MLYCLWTSRAPPSIDLDNVSIDCNLKRTENRAVEDTNTQGALKKPKRQRKLGKQLKKP